MFTARCTSSHRALIVACVALAAALPAHAGPTPPIAVRIGSIFAADPNLAHIVKETLATDFAKSSRLTVLSGSSRQLTGVCTVTGSCLFNDESVIINLRMVNAAGGTVPGAAENIEGPRSQLFRLVQSLAGKFTSRICGGPAPVSIAKSSKPSAPKNGIVLARSEPAADAPPASLGDTPGTDYDELDAQDDRSRSNSKPNVDRPGRYTSVIVDARGLGLERSMCAKIRRTDGSTVYDGADCSPDFAIEKGVVAYARSLEEARDLSRAGARPLVLTAVDRYEQPLPGDPLISDEDAAFLVKAARRDGFLKKFNVIFVIDR